MRESKDRGSKWLIEHHGDSSLRLARVVGLTTWRTKQAEVVAPKSLPDGLLEVQFPDQVEAAEPAWRLQRRSAIIPPLTVHRRAKTPTASSAY